MQSARISDEIVETMADAVVVIDADGAIVFVNEQVERLSGYAGAELVGHSIEMLVPAHLRAEHETHRTHYLDAPVPRPMGTALDTRLRHRDGHEIPVDIALSAIDGPDGRRAVAVVRDATAAREAQRSLAEQAHMLELAHDGILIRRVRDSVITYWSQGAVELYGFSRRQAIGRSSHELLRTVFPESQEALEQALAARGNWEGELLHARRDSTQVMVSSRQVLVGGADGTILEINRDITEERRGRDRLEALREVTEAILADRSRDDVLRLIAQRALALAGAAVATIALAEPGGESLVVQVADGAGADAVLGMRLPAGASISGRTLATRSAVLVSDLPSEPDAFPDFARAAGVGPAMFLPLAGQTEDVGTMMLGRPPGSQPFDNADRGTLELFANTAAVALERSAVRENLERVRLLEDRERIGRDLHDGTIQTLFALSMRLQHVALLTQDRDVATRLEESVGTIDQVIRDLRGYVFGLRPGAVRERSLEAALVDLVRDFDRDSGISTALDVDASAAEALAAVASDVLQIVAEALSNVRRHASASTCRVELRRSDVSVVVRIEDDGVGFDPAAATGAGHGLRNFRQRAQRLGGTLAIESPEDGGAAIAVTIPA